MSTSITLPTVPALGITLEASTGNMANQALQWHNFISVELPYFLATNGKDLISSAADHPLFLASHLYSETQLIKL